MTLKLTLCGKSAILYIELFLGNDFFISKVDTIMINLAEYIKNNIDILCCPKCTGHLDFASNNFVCLNCRQKYNISNNIPQLFWQNEWDPLKDDITNKIKSFYEKSPFPNYDDFDDVGSLIVKARKGIFAKLLDDQIPFGTRILDCGCGTGQLTNFLSVANRTVIGADICMNSLNMAQDFQKKNSLNRAFFFQMNLFRPCFKHDIFDLVISNGVLHHTSDPFTAFKTISTLVKPKGYLLVGLYHKYGRIANDIRRHIFKLTNDKLLFLDHRIIDKKISKAKRDAWFLDQYKNPYESKHTIGEVVHWLDKIGFVFIHSIPKAKLFQAFSDKEKLFKKEKPGNWLERFIIDIGMLFTGSSEGGFFIIIAKKT